MTKRATAAIVLIGEELLSGKIDDRNGALSIRLMRDLGISLRELRMIGDEVETIARVVAEVAETCDFVVTSGGIGPTHDDVTMRGLAAAFGVGMEEHADLRALIERRFAELPEQRRIWLRMAQVPQGTEVLMAEQLRLPVYRLRNVWALPGVPELFELQIHEVLGRYRATPPTMQVLYLTVGEGEIAEALEQTLEELGEQVQIGSYPVLAHPEHRTRVTVESQDARSVQQAVDRLSVLLPSGSVLRVEHEQRLS